jgi:hypothetical protein
MNEAKSIRYTNTANVVDLIPVPQPSRHLVSADRRVLKAETHSPAVARINRRIVPARK